MFENVFTNYLSGYQSITRTFNDALWSQWRLLFTPCKLSMAMMDDILIGSARLYAVPDEPQKADPGSTAEAAAAPDKEGSPETLEQRAMNRLSHGYAPPREIYDVRNRGQINWSKVPEWAKPADPELFEGAHEG